jgi:hypothetical protein
MRVAIEPQIEEYRKYNKLICIKCKSKIKPNVDHYNPKFKDLKNDFLNVKNNIPIFFSNNTSNQKCFTKEDEEFEKKWYEYHQQNAKLRILCSKCNQEREKPNYKSDDEIL